MRASIMKTVVNNVQNLLNIPYAGGRKYLTCPNVESVFTLTLAERTYDADALASIAASAESHPAITFCHTWLNGRQTFILHTSGSTGPPKSIVLRREQMIASAHMTGRALNLRPGDRALVCLSTRYIAGVMMLVRGMELGLALTVVDPARNPLAAFSAETRFDFTAVVPLQMQTLLNSPQRAIVNRMRVILIGGAAVSDALHHELQTVDAAVYNSYGMTETVTHIALRRLNGPQADDAFTPLSGVTLDVDGRGCLTITAPVTGGVTLITNDRVDLLPDGRFRWLGRADHVINSGGHKVQAEQVEAALHAVLDDDRRVLVGGVADPELGQRVVALVEGAPAPFDLAERLRQSGHLHRYATPREIIYVPHLPETSGGKLDRRAALATLTGTTAPPTETHA